MHEEGHLWSKGGVSCDDRHGGYTIIQLSNWTVGLMNFISYILCLNKNDFKKRIRNSRLWWEKKPRRGLVAGAHGDQGI